MTSLSAPILGTDVESGATTYSSNKLSISDAWLLRYNKIGGFLHFAQGTLMLMTYFFGPSSVRDFTRPISYSYVVYDQDTKNFAQEQVRAMWCLAGTMNGLRRGGCSVWAQPELFCEHHSPTRHVVDFRLQHGNRPRHSLLLVPLRPSPLYTRFVPWLLS